MDPVTVLGLVAYFLLALGLVLTRLPVPCGHPSEPCRVCAREAADRRRRDLEDAHHLGAHRRPFEGCPSCEEKL